MRLVLVSAVLASTAALAGVTVVYERVDRTGSKSTMTIKVEGERLRVDTPASKLSRMLWDGTKKEVVLLRDADKVYSRLDEPKARALKERLAVAREKSAANVAAARAGLEAKLATMPPAQREQMEKMLKGLSASGEPAKYEPPKFTATGKKQKVGEWACEVHEATRDGQRHEVCVVPWDKAPLKKEDMKAFVSLNDFFLSMSGGLGSPQGDDVFTRELHNYPGYPVLSTTVEPGGQRATFTTRSVTRGAVPAGEFALPQGYAEQPMAGVEPPPAP